jgi:mannitol/fructose-specific phosphotransferase system IIA component (Ntr-type)
MVLSENLNSLNILVHAEAKTRWDLIKEMVGHAVTNSLIPVGTEADITSALIEREKSMSTGIGKGVAIPHCTVTNIDEIVVMMATNEKGINFDAIDSLPVKIVIMLLVPKSKLTQHIKTLANIAKAMSDDIFKEKLLTYSKSDELIDFIKSYEKAK